MELARRLVITMCLVLFCNDLAFSETDSEKAARSMQNDQEVMKAIADYVVRTKGWPQGSFTVTIDSPHKGKHVFLVAKPYNTAPQVIGGDGNSFGVLVDPESHHIVGILNYQ